MTDPEVFPETNSIETIPGSSVLKHPVVMGVARVVDADDILIPNNPNRYGDLIDTFRSFRPTQGLESLLNSSVAHAFIPPCEPFDHDHYSDWLESLSYTWTSVQHLLNRQFMNVDPGITTTAIRNNVRRLSRISPFCTPAMYPERTLYVINGCPEFLVEELFDTKNPDHQAFLKLINNPLAVSNTIVIPMMFGSKRVGYAGIVNGLYVGHTGQHPAFIKYVSTQAMLGESLQKYVPFSKFSSRYTPNRRNIHTIDIVDKAEEAVLVGEEVFIPRYFSPTPTQADPMPRLVDIGKGTEQEFIEAVFSYAHRRAYLDVVTKVQDINRFRRPGTHFHIDNVVGVDKPSTDYGEQFFRISKPGSEVLGRYADLLTIPGAFLRNIHKRTDEFGAGIDDVFTSIYRVELPMQNNHNPVAAMIIEIGFEASFSYTTGKVKLRGIVRHDRKADEELVSDTKLFVACEGVLGFASRSREHRAMLNAFTGGLVRGK